MSLFHEAVGFDAKRKYPLNKNGIPILDGPRKKKPKNMCSQCGDGEDDMPICARCVKANELADKLFGKKHNKEFDHNRGYRRQETEEVESYEDEEELLAV